MPSRVVVSLIPLSPRDRQALCVSCNRRGTFAAVAHEAESDVFTSRNREHHIAFGPTAAPPRIDRYCRRCWPPAQVQLQRQQKAARARAAAEFRKQMAADALEGGSPPSSIGVGAIIVTFHWSLAAGTWWREWRRDAIYRTAGADRAG